MADTMPDASRFADNFAYETVNSRERALALVLAAALLAANAAVEPFARIHLPVIRAFLPVIETAAFIGLCLTAAMLYSQYRVGRYAPLAILACAFAVFGVLQVPYLLTFPGIFSEAGLMGAGPQTAVWLYVLSRLAFAMLIIGYVLIERDHLRSLRKRAVHLVPIGLGSVLFTIGAIALSTCGHGLLPSLIVRNGLYAPLYPHVIIPIVIAALGASLAALFCLTRLQARVHVWLATMIVSMILEVCVSGLLSGGRYTVGWYLARVDLAIDATVFIALMHTQLASILRRSADSAERAHSIYEFILVGQKSLSDCSERMLMFAKRSLDFEVAFLARAVESDFIIETSAGDLDTLSIRRGINQMALYHEAVNKNVLLCGDDVDGTEAPSRRAAWPSYAVMPILIEDAQFGVVVFASSTQRSRALNAADKTFIRLVGVLAGSNIERARQHGRLNKMAFYDTLTGLPNRDLLMDRLRQAIVTGKRDGKSFTVHFLDVDHFKSINDQYGHASGDEVLSEVARRLSGLVRASDTVARYGGDEFIILAPNVTGRPDVSAIQPRIRSVFDTPLHIAGNLIAVNLSVGASNFPFDGEDADTLLRLADEALYRAKAMRPALDLKHSETIPR